MDSPDSVEIYAPYCVHGLADPSTPYYDVATVDGVCGTSEAAPFVAGVAALVKAADPALTQGQVRQILLTTANVGDLGSKVTGSQRRVDAFAAVASALGVTVGAPTVKITSPADGSQHKVGDTVHLTASTADYAGQALPVQWKSSIDGNLGGPTKGTLDWWTLSEGTHTISARATDDRGAFAQDFVTIVVGTPTVVTMLSPATGVPSFVVNQPIGLVATTYDADGYGPLLDSEVKWTVRNFTTNQVVYASTGHRKRMTGLVPGLYAAQFTAGGSSQQRLFQVVPNLGHPTATITTPTMANNLVLDTTGAPRDVYLSGSGSEPLNTSVPGTRFRWIAHSGATTKVLCTGSAVPGQNADLDKLVFPSSCKSIFTELGLDQSVIGGDLQTVWLVTLEVYGSTGLVSRDLTTVTIRAAAVG